MRGYINTKRGITCLLGDFVPEERLSRPFTSYEVTQLQCSQKSFLCFFGAGGKDRNSQILGRFPAQTGPRGGGLGKVPVVAPLDLHRCSAR